MRFKESETLALRNPALASVIARVDSALDTVAADGVLSVALWSRLVGDTPHRVRSVLEGLVALGLLASDNVLECECGTVSTNDTCPSCLDQPRHPRKVVRYVFSDEAKLSKQEAALAEQTANAPLPRLTERPDATIGIIAALPHEFAAMRAMLEEPAYWYAPGGRRYAVGSIPSVRANHCVALALLAGPGNNLTAAVAAKFRVHLPMVREIVMCGIAGGVPYTAESEHDVRLGDIVYSDSSGVIQSDFGREEAGRWSPRHSPRPPSARFLEACRNLKADEIGGKRPWEGHIARGGVTLRVVRPGDQEDAQGNQIIYPQDAVRRAQLPRVFNGVIASSNTLQKNPGRRDELRALFGVKAVEMEASGLADASWLDDESYFVVRGIVDYCDDRKGDHWHHYASIAAAAFVRTILESMPAED